MAGVEEVEDITEVKDITEIKGMNKDVKKKGEHYDNAGHMRLTWVWIKEAAK